MAKSARVKLCLALARDSARASMEPEDRDVLDVAFKEILSKEDSWYTDARVDRMLGNARQSAMRQVRRQEKDKLNLQKNLDELDAVAPEKQAEGMRDLMEPRALFGRGSEHQTFRSHLAGLLSSERQMALSRAYHALQRLHNYKFGVWATQDVKHADNVMAEMLAQNTGDNIAKESASVFHNIIHEYLERLKKTGIHVPEMPNYFPRSHNLGRITANADSLQTWKTMLTEVLDPMHHPTPGKTVDDLLETLLAGQGKSPGQDLTIELGRKLHFKDAVGELRYFREFGDGTVHDVLVNHLSTLANKTVLAEEFGSRPFVTIQKMMDAAETASKKAGVDPSRVNTLVERTNNLVQAFSGEMGTPANAGLAAVGRTLRNHVIMRALGRVVFWAIPDQVFTAHALSGIQKGNAVRQYRFILDSLKRNVDNLQGRYGEAAETEMFRIQRSLGIGQNIFSANVLDRIAPVDAIGSALGGTAQRTGVGRFEKFAEKNVAGMMRMTGASQMMEAQQSAVGLTYNRVMATLAGKSWKEVKEINPTLWERMKTSGINEEMWGRIAQKEHVTGEFLDGFAIKDDRARGALAAFLDRESKFSVFMPDMYTRIMTGGLLRAGTVEGEAFRFAMQFQSAAIGVIRQQLARASREGRVTTLAMPLIGSAMLKIQMESVLKGEPTFEMDSPVLWAKAMDQSGLLYLAGIMASKATSSSAQGRDFRLSEALGASFGPVFQDAIKGADIGFDLMGDLSEDWRVKDKTVARAAEWMTRNIWYNNVWWIGGWLTNGIIGELRDYGDPGEAIRQEVRWMREGRNVD